LTPQTNAESLPFFRNLAGDQQFHAIAQGDVIIDAVEPRRAGFGSGDPLWIARDGPVEAKVSIKPLQQ
jgi:hypothetical protein